VSQVKKSRISIKVSITVSATSTTDPISPEIEERIELTALII